MAILFLILLLPFIFVSKIFNPYEFPKFIFFVAGVEILALYFVWKRLGKKKLLDISRIDIGAFLVLGFGLVNLMSDIFGVDPRVSLLGTSIRHQGFLTLVAGIILFFLARFSFKTKSYLFFQKGILLSAFLLSLIPLWQILEINLFHNYSIPTYNGRIIGTMGNPNFLGGYLVMVLPFLFFNGKRTLREIVVRGVIIFAVLAAIFFTDSRSAFLAAAFVVIAYLIYLYRKTIILAAAILIVLFFMLVQSINFSIQKTDSNLKSNLSDQEIMCHAAWPQSYPLKFLTDMQEKNVFSERGSFCDSRFLVWLMGGEAIMKRPIIGYGQENFELAIPSGKMHVVDNAHNIFLETAVASGIIGLLLYISIVFYFLKKTLRLDIRLSIIAFLIVAQFNPLSIAQIALFWFLLGIALKDPPAPSSSS